MENKKWLMDCKRPEIKDRKSKTYEKTMEWIEGLKKTHVWVAPESTPGVISICPKRILKKSKKVKKDKK
tara:strand:- start:40 stop:246 length:207 start_codon:yes stop_codon:yes gene_type:complete